MPQATGSRQNSTPLQLILRQPAALGEIACSATLAPEFCQGLFHHVGEVCLPARRLGKEERGGHPLTPISATGAGLLPHGVGDELGLLPFGGFKHASDHAHASFLRGLLPQLAASNSARSSTSFCTDLPASRKSWACLVISSGTFSKPLENNRAASLRMAKSCRARRCARPHTQTQCAPGLWRAPPCECR